MVILGDLTARQPPFPLIAAGLCPNLPLVKTASFDADITVRPHNHHGTISASSPRRTCLGAEWYMASGSRRFTGLRRRPHWVVRARRVES